MTSAIVDIIYGIIIVILATWPSIILNKRMMRKFPHRLSFAWGYFLSLAVLIAGVISLWLAFTDSNDRGVSIAWGVTAWLLGAMLYRRNRWVWLAFVIIQLNPGSWIINGIYLKNRWAEMRDDK